MRTPSAIIDTVRVTRCINHNAIILPRGDALRGPVPDSLTLTIGIYFAEGATRPTKGQLEKLNRMLNRWQQGFPLRVKMSADLACINPEGMSAGFVLQDGEELRFAPDAANDNWEEVV